MDKRLINIRTAAILKKREMKHEISSNCQPFSRELMEADSTAIDGRLKLSETLPVQENIISSSTVNEMKPCRVGRTRSRYVESSVQTGEFGHPFTENGTRANKTCSMASPFGYIVIPFSINIQREAEPKQICSSHQQCAITQRITNDYDSFSCHGSAVEFQHSYDCALTEYYKRVWPATPTPVRPSSLNVANGSGPSSNGAVSANSSGKSPCKFKLSPVILRSPMKGPKSPIYSLPNELQRISRDLGDFLQDVSLNELDTQFIDELAASCSNNLMDISGLGALDDLHMGASQLTPCKEVKEEYDSAETALVELADSLMASEDSMRAMQQDAACFPELLGEMTMPAVMPKKECIEMSVHSAALVEEISNDDTFGNTIDAVPIGTVNVYFNDFPYLLISNQRYIRLVDIHKIALPSKEVATLTKRAQEMGFEVVRCSEFQRQFLIRNHAYAVSSRSNAMVTVDAAERILRFYMENVPTIQSSDVQAKPNNLIFTEESVTPATQQDANQAAVTEAAKMERRTKRRHRMRQILCKLRSRDDDFCSYEDENYSLTGDSSGTLPFAVPRKRGRPRKDPSQSECVKKRPRAPSVPAVAGSALLTQLLEPIEDSSQEAAAQLESEPAAEEVVMRDCCVPMSSSRTVKVRLACWSRVPEADGGEGLIHLNFYESGEAACVQCCLCEAFYSVERFLDHGHAHDVSDDDWTVTVNSHQHYLEPVLKTELDQMRWAEFQRRRRFRQFLAARKRAQTKKTKLTGRRVFTRANETFHEHPLVSLWKLMSSTVLPDDLFHLIYNGYDTLFTHLRWEKHPLVVHFRYLCGIYHLILPVLVLSNARSRAGCTLAEGTIDF